MVSCTQCPSPAVAEYREPGGEPITLCDECTVRYVRVAGIKGLLLMISAFRRESVEPEPAPGTIIDASPENPETADTIVHEAIDRATGEER